ncbi:anti-sigma-D factor RsdA [Nocardia sp. BMG51109]|uniref:anti-sigma-D factor RsdA n=1 Tax=Nocardia sp. BMG51109 TaxID=1056816 RepID=UPI0004652D20|nr:anti-sigma-D factor RsdA [Nocardia sp. BMG51109]
MARDGERGRGDWKARRGSHNSDPYADASGDTGPVDIAAVRRDDTLIDAIAGDGPVTTDSPEEYQLATLLANWRAEIVEEPLPGGPDLDAVVAAVNQEIGARQARVNVGRRSRLRLVRPLMGAAAAVALIFGGTTAFSYSAQPGDPLWRVKEVVFSQQAQTTIAQRADDDLTAAQNFIDQGQPERAQPLLEGVRHTATQVDDGQRKHELEERWNQLVAQLNAKAPDIAASLAPLTPSNTSGRPQPSTTDRPGSRPTTTPDIGILGGTGSNEPDSGEPSTKPGSTAPTFPSLPTSGLPTLPQEPPSNEPTAGPTTIGSTGASIPDFPSGRPGSRPDQNTVRPSLPQVGPTTVILPPAGSLPGGLR